MPQRDMENLVPVTALEYMKGNYIVNKRLAVCYKIIDMC